MDKVTQQTAVNAEDSASASEEMNSQAEKLKYFIRDLTVLVDGKGNGGVESRSEPLSKKLIRLVHLQKNAPLEVPEMAVVAKNSVTRRKML